MFTSEHYQLLDFGHGRKLERFEQLVLDRPCPAADDFDMATPAAWRAAAARYERDAIDHRSVQRSEAERGVWKPADATASTWTIEHVPFRLELRATEFGHLGVFPEQADNWDWIARQVQRAGRPLKVLNLFAYTGGSTLAAAAAGAEVVHVDAARTSVAWARRNAQLSGLAVAPIRWIVDDARKFVRRELKRGNAYDAVILDPPTYGHGTKGEVWKLAEHLPALLADCGELTAASRQFMLLSCHAPGIGPAELEAYLADAIFGHCAAGVRAAALSLSTPDGRRLPSGVVARWPG